MNGVVCAVRAEDKERKLGPLSQFCTGNVKKRVSDSHWSVESRAVKRRSGGRCEMAASLVS
jgi:hypothetical protein